MQMLAIKATEMPQNNTQKSRAAKKNIAQNDCDMENMNKGISI